MRWCARIVTRTHVEVRYLGMLTPVPCTNLSYSGLGPEEHKGIPILRDQPTVGSYLVYPSIPIS